MPCVERCHLSVYASIGVDTPHAAGPIDKSEFTRSWDPGFMCDPFVLFDVTGIETTVTSSVAMNYPHSISKGTRIVEQVGIVGTELKVSNTLSPQDDIVPAGVCVYNSECGLI